MTKIIRESCGVCGNVSGYDKQSLKASTWNINGEKIVLCCPCEDELLVKIAKGRGLIIKLDGGEIDTLTIIRNSINNDVVIKNA
jgi:hypothetical protein